MIIKSIAINADGGGKAFDGDLVEGFLAEKLKEFLFDGNFCERGFGHVNLLPAKLQDARR